MRTVIVARSRARLREVQQGVLQVCRQLADLQGVSCGIDPATARVRVRVTQRHAARLREMLAGHPGLAGDPGAVVVVEVPPERGVISLGPGPRVTHAGWPVPTVSTAEAVGQPAGEVAGRYRDEGFTVELLRYGEPAFFPSDWSKNRIRVLVRDGSVVDARQGSERAPRPNISAPDRRRGRGSGPRRGAG